MNFFRICHNYYRKIWTFPCKLKKKRDLYDFFSRSYGILKLVMHFCTASISVTQCALREGCWSDFAHCMCLSIFLLCVDEPWRFPFCCDIKYIQKYTYT